jgi:hypothetical protein
LIYAAETPSVGVVVQSEQLNEVPSGELDSTEIDWKQATQPPADGHPDQW